MRSGPSSGYTLIELMFVAGLTVTISGIAIPQVLAGLDDLRATGAVRYVATRLQRARSEAVRRSADVAMRFAQVDGRYAFATYVDGNRNGVRTRDIAKGIDSRLGHSERLADSFKDVEFGTIPGLPGIDGGAPPDGDPIRLGPGGFATFTPAGTSTAGSLYIRNQRGSQYVLRIFGDTGKVRVLKFHTRTKQWKPL